MLIRSNLLNKSRGRKNHLRNFGSRKNADRDEQPPRIELGDHGHLSTCCWSGGAVVPIACRRQAELTGRKMYLFQLVRRNCREELLEVPGGGACLSRGAACREELRRDRIRRR